MKKRSLVFLLCGIGLLAAGCVSSGKYKKLEKLYAQSQEKLEETGIDNEALESANADLSVAKSELEIAKAALTSENTKLAEAKQQLEGAKQRLSQENADLARTKEALQLAKEELETAKSALESEREGLLTEKKTLAEEKAALEKQNAELLKAQRKADAEFNDLRNKLQTEIKEGQLKITQYKNMMALDVAEKAFFDSGRARLKDEGRGVLGKLAEAINKYPEKYVRIVGHTDSVPIKKSKFKDNWDLSAARSATVVRYLVEKGGVEGTRLEIAARGEFDPVADNATKEGRQANRRIEILLIDKALFEKTQAPVQAGKAEGKTQAPKESGSAAEQ